MFQVCEEQAQASAEGKATRKAGVVVFEGLPSPRDLQALSKRPKQVLNHCLLPCRVGDRRRQNVKKKKK